MELQYSIAAISERHCTIEFRYIDYIYGNHRFSLGRSVITSLTRDGSDAGTAHYTNKCWEHDWQDV